MAKRKQHIKDNTPKVLQGVKKVNASDVDALVDKVNKGRSLKIIVYERYGEWHLADVPGHIATTVFGAIKRNLEPPKGTVLFSGSKEELKTFIEVRYGELL